MCLTVLLHYLAQLMSLRDMFLQISDFNAMKGGKICKICLFVLHEGLNASVSLAVEFRSVNLQRLSGAVT
jgi:hypothetical protein